MEMCIEGMEWDLFCVLQMSKPQTFQELATMAHNIEEMIANHHGISFNFVESNSDKVEFKRNVKVSQNSTNGARYHLEGLASSDYEKAKTERQKERTCQGCNRGIPR